MSEFKIAFYDKLISNNANFERKGKTMPYTSINGHVFSFISKEDVMGLRLSQIDREEFIEDFDGKLMVQHGRTMKEFIQIPDDLLENMEELSKLLDKSFNYVFSLKPKPLKNRK